MRRLRHIRIKWPIIALIALYSYLAFHAFSGSQGLVKWMDYADQRDTLTIRKAALVAEREALEDQVSRLSAGQLNLDSLDMAARETLFVSKPDEVTIWLDPKP